MPKRADLKSVPDIQAGQSLDLPDTPGDKLPVHTEVSTEVALDTLLNHYVRRRDFFMAERLAHDLDRLRESES